MIDESIKNLVDIANNLRNKIVISNGLVTRKVRKMYSSIECGPTKLVVKEL